MAVYGLNVLIYEGGLKSSLAEKFIGWKVHMMMLSICFQMGLKLYNSNRKSVLTAERTMLKNEAHLVTFHESILVSLQTFQPNLVYIYIYIYIYIYNCYQSKNSISYVNITHGHTFSIHFFKFKNAFIFKIGLLI